MENKPRKPRKHQGSLPVPERHPTASGSGSGSAPAPLGTSDEAAAVVLKHALAQPTLPTAEALKAHRQRVAALVDPTSADALKELSRQLPVLEALWQRLAYDALQARSLECRAQLTRAAIQAQQAHARTFALLRGLALQGKGLAAVTVDEPSEGCANVD